MKRMLWTMAAVLAVVGILSTAQARTAAHPATHSRSSVLLAPNYMIAEHNVGKLVLSVLNNGTFGDGFSPICSSDYCNDSFTGLRITSCEFPKGSKTKYLYAGGLWIGAVVGNDTLVSTAADGWQMTREFNPEEGDLGRMIYRSTLDPLAPEAEGAVSEQDYVSTYFDTCTTCPGLQNDVIDGRPHLPIGIEVHQESYAWSHPLSEDIILFNLHIKNISEDTINDMYVGLLADGDVYQIGYDGYSDDVTGFRSVPRWAGNLSCPSNLDSLKVAWIADNDGDLDATTHSPVPNVTGVSWLASPVDDAEVSYNWWISNGNPTLDFGPQRKGNYRDFGTGGEGTPEGDRNKYFMLRNGDIDYDQVFVASIEPTDPVWTYPPPSQASVWAQGMDTRYLLSTGPIDLAPGDSVPLVFAYFGGENLHLDSLNINNLPDNPAAYLAGLNFADFDQNARFAAWIYDNPGVDTDSDGYAGEYVVCLGDTVWIKGDGVPDFHDPAYVPAPPQDWLRVDPLPGALRVRWNGLSCETTPDVFNQCIDFEGYNVYMASQDIGKSAAAKIAGYDVQDYLKYIYRETLGRWELHDNPFTQDSLFALYGQGDPSWTPDDYPETHPFVWTGGSEDSIFYFAPFLDNADQFGVETPIVKRFPGAPKPWTTDPSDIPPEQRSLYLTDDGFFKYYEYELVVENLLPTRHYFLYLTSIDNGSVDMGLGAGESQAVTSGAVTPDSPTDTPEDPPDALPQGFSLAQNYPNPFNPGTYISFMIPRGSHVKLDVLNIAGQTVATLVDEYLSVGTHTAYWDATGNASGVYLYRLSTSDFTATKKMILLK